MNVVFQDKGTDFPPSVIPVEDRASAVRYIVNEVAKTAPHWTENATVDDAERKLAECNTFSMTERSGSQYVWTIQ